jgi:signal transduction histidine kinase
VFIVLLIPYGRNLLLFYIVLVILLQEASGCGDSSSLWIYVFPAGLIAFAFLLPKRVWGEAVSGICWYDAVMMSLFSAFLGRQFRHATRLEAEMERMNIQLSRSDRLVSQVYELNRTFQEVALSARRQSAEEERKRITRDIHDIMGYTLVNLRVMLEVALDLASEADFRLHDLLHDASLHCRDGLQQARMALRNLRNYEEKNMNWEQTVCSITDTFMKATGIQADVFFSNVSLETCPVMLSAVYQFIQESLTNSFKHGMANHVHIEFRAADGMLTVRITDDGCGAGEIVPGIGLSGMQERMHAVGGNLSYRNVSDGFEVKTELPLALFRG